MRRSPIVAVLVLCLSFFGMLAVAPEATAATAKSAPTGKVKVVVSAPKGVRVPIQLVGPKKRVVATVAKGTKRTLTLPRGTYTVKVPQVVVKGVTYALKKGPRKIRIGSKKVRAKFVVKKLADPGLYVSSATSSSITLGWKKPKKHSTVILRRALGTVAPAGPKAGKAVKVKASKTSVVDSKVKSGKTYAYSLFVRKGRSTARSVVTAGTPNVGTGAPTFALARNAAIVESGDSDVPNVSNGVVSVRLGAKRPTPPIGAGFVLPVSSVLPGGFIGTVSGLSPDGRTVTLASGGLADVFSSLDITSDVPSEPVTLDPVGAPESSADDDVAYARRAVEARALSAASSSSGESCFNTSLSNQVSNLHPILTPSGSFHSEVKSKFGVPYAVKFSVSAAMTAGFGFDIETEAAVSCGIEFKKLVKTWMAGPVPLTLVFDPTLEVSISGAIEETGFQSTLTGGMSADGQLGLGGYFHSRPIFHGDVTQPTVTGKNASLGLTLGGDLTFGPGAGSDSAGVVAGVNGWLNPLNASVSVSGVSGASTAAACVEASAKTEGGFGLEAKAWAGSFNWSASWRPEALTFSHSWFDKYYPEGCQNPPVTGSGDVKATLTWGSAADLDLHVTDPSGDEIYFGNDASESGGALDVDANAACWSVASQPTENIYWPSGGAPAGTYHVQVVTWSPCDETDLSWHLQVWVKGVLVVDQRGSDTSPVYDVTLD